MKHKRTKQQLANLLRSNMLNIDKYQHKSKYHSNYHESDYDQYSSLPECSFKGPPHHILANTPIVMEQINKMSAIAIMKLHIQLLLHKMK